jgi:hypothetical protein
MVPIHDTDVAEERWSKAEWEGYELWEKIEARLKKRRRLWIFSTAVVILVLSAIPLIYQKWEKWMTRSLARQLAVKLNQMKSDAGIQHVPFRLKLIEGKDSLDYVIEKLKTCSDPKGEVTENGTLAWAQIQSRYTWLTPEKGKLLEVPGLSSEVCYDPLLGIQTAAVSDVKMTDQKVIGFGILPVKDLSNHEIDNLSIVLLTPPEGEVTFE